MSNLCMNLVATACRYPDRPALRCDDLELSFNQFDVAAARVATLLERDGIEPGDRVGLMLPNTSAFAVGVYGILRRGAVAVPMNPLLKAREIEFYLDQHRPDCDVCHPGVRRAPQERSCAAKSLFLQAETHKHESLLAHSAAHHHACVDASLSSVIRRTHNDIERRVLEIDTYAATPSRRGTPTTFTVDNLPHRAHVSVYVDGRTCETWRRSDAGDVAIDLDADTHQIRLTYS
jgi:non-ribosomal peptide synthetase component E (peptide arylation enzyme)